MILYEVGGIMWFLAIKAQLGAAGCRFKMQTSDSDPREEEKRKEQARGRGKAGL